METVKIILQFIGAAVVIMMVFGWLLYLFFCKNITIEELDEEDGYEREEEFIDQMIQQ